MRSLLRSGPGFLNFSPTGIGSWSILRGGRLSRATVVGGITASLTSTHWVLIAPFTPQPKMPLGMAWSGGGGHSDSWLRTRGLEREENG